MKNREYIQRQKLDKFLRSPKTLKKLQKIAEKNGISVSDDDLQMLVTKFMNGDEM